MVVTLMSSDNKMYEIEENAANLMLTIKAAIEDTNGDDVIPISNVTGNILKLVIDYCKFNISDPSDDDRKKWEADYLKIDHETLFQLVIAANFLNCTILLDLTCKNIADQIRGKKTEEIRKHFNIKSDFTPEEEEEIRLENEWCENSFK